LVCKFGDKPGLISFRDYVYGGTERMPVPDGNGPEFVGVKVIAQKNCIGFRISDFPDGEILWQQNDDNIHGIIGGFGEFFHKLLQLVECRPASKKELLVWQQLSFTIGPLKNIPFSVLVQGVRIRQIKTVYSTLHNIFM
jgi:hypothetical protein